MTADLREQIRVLVDVLAGFLPMDTRSRSGTTFRTIFAESGVARYLIGDSKRKALQAGMERVLRHHPKLPFVLVRKIVPAAVDYRRFKRNPLRRVELAALVDALCEVGVDMRRELESIELNETVPEIQVPPNELVQRLENHPLVPAIAGEPLVLFRNGHFNEAVRKAAERFEVAVQAASGMDEIGQDLMAKAFRLDGGPIRVNALATENDREIQEGVLFMAMGMTRAIRNVFSHGDEAQRPPEEAYEMLMFLNWLFGQLPLQLPAQ